MLVLLQSFVHRQRYWPFNNYPQHFIKREGEVVQSEMELLRRARHASVSEVPPARQAAEEGKANWQEGDLGTAQKSARGF